MYAVLCHCMCCVVVIVCVVLADLKTKKWWSFPWCTVYWGMCSHVRLAEPYIQKAIFLTSVSILFFLQNICPYLETISTWMCGWEGGVIMDIKTQLGILKGREHRSWNCRKAVTLIYSHSSQFVCFRQICRKQKEKCTFLVYKKCDTEGWCRLNWKKVYWS